MLAIIIKHLSNKYGGIKTPKARQVCGEVCGTLGIILNVLLFAAKLFAGVICNSLAITADAFNNLSDAGSSVITLIGFKISAKKPDSEHPFGHARAEYISSLLISVMILAMGAELLKSSVKKIISPDFTEYTAATFVILIICIVTKIYMASYNRKYGKLLSSDSMIAVYRDSLCDAIATFAVLCTASIGRFFNINIDGWCGAAVALFILYSGFKSAMSNVSTFLGRPADKQLIDDIKNLVLQTAGIAGVHDIVVHDYGPGKMMITLHAEVSPDANVIELHSIIEHAENALEDKYKCRAMIHMDPISPDGSRKSIILKCVCSVLHGIDVRLDTHDFRVDEIDGKEYISFDVEAPYDLDMPDDELKERIKSALKSMFDKSLIRITIDRK